MPALAGVEKVLSKQPQLKAMKRSPNCSKKYGAIRTKYVMPPSDSVGRRRLKPNADRSRKALERVSTFLGEVATEPDAKGAPYCG